MAKKSKIAQKRKSIQWDKYAKSDWRPLGGSSRRYALKKHPKLEISREQFDKHYGTLKEFGSFRKKAAKRKGTLAQAIAPARGRKSARKATPAQQEVAFANLERKRKESATDKHIAKERHRKVKPLESVSLKYWKRGKAIARFRVPFSQQGIEHAREVGQRSGIVWSYYVVVLFITSSDLIKSYAIFGARSIKMRFTKSDFNKALKLMKQKGYSDNIIGVDIVFKLNAESQKRNGIENPR